MDNYAYNSYAESGDSSPRSREIDFENPPPWDDAQLQNQNYKVKFMCSYGGKIHPRPHDNLLSYVGGETKIFAVDRSVKFASMLAKLSSLCDTDVTFKYQLPGEDLDALISVTNDDDLEHMMHEYDRLYRAPGKPARMRLFLFPANQSPSFGSEGGRSDRDRFVEVLSSGSTHGGDVPKQSVPNKVDFLFGLDKGGIASPSPPVALKLHDPLPEPVAPPMESAARPVPGDRIAVSDPGVHPAEIQRQLQELQRLHISEQEQAAAYRRKPEEHNLMGGYGGDFYAQKMVEKTPPPSAQPTLQPPAGYWSEKQVSSGGFPATMTATPGGQDQPPVYMIHAPGAVYHSPQHPMVRQVNAPPPNQGYYAVQRMASDVYREQPVYNVVQPPQPSYPPTSSPSLPQQPPKVAAYPGGGITLAADSGPYTQVAYDSTTGRQVYYTAGGAAMVASPPTPPYQGVSAPMSGDIRTGPVGQDGKLIAKISQGSV
ncbi:uncharacterized protein LOC111811512 [Cucurbita pepo subsp. pepo]|uniref:uncharacterized protein LOC111811512 n=1 Tax=Cucurbita pepo subsp. pepo TaxID=3664 RepID=UPI000C9D31B0|nr:uncharacterized protein LOC111811512 [Cucurbita pepo subsp. pepo]